MPASTNTISGAPRDPEDDGGGQAAKNAFLAKARQSGGAQNYVQGTRMRALSPFEVKAGWDIPAVLEQDINSDLPGEIRALVRESVFDTASGNFLLIPQGSRLVGQYDSKVAYAQNALLVVWDRVIFPDGSSIDLEGMGSQDVKGQSGLRGKVNHHYGRLFGTAALSTAFSVAAVVAQNRPAERVFIAEFTGRCNVGGGIRNFAPGSSDHPQESEHPTNDTDSYWHSLLGAGA